MKIILIFVLLFLLTVGNVLGQFDCPQMLVVSARYALAEKCKTHNKHTKINPKRVFTAMTCTAKLCTDSIKNYDHRADFKAGMDAGNKLSCDDFDNKLFATIMVQYELFERELIKICPFEHEHSRAVENEINTDSLCIEKFNKFDKKFNLWEKYILESSIRFGIYAKQHMELKKWRKDIMNLYKQGNYKGCEKMATKGLLYIPS